MSNPYHDETGKFCSSDEMQGAIDRLAKAGRVDEYFALRNEFENIQQDKVVISRELLAAYSSGVSLGSRTIITPEDYKALHSTINWDDPKTIPTEYETFRRLEDPNLPDDVRQDILANAPVGLKTEVLRRIAKDQSPVLASDILKLAEGETDNELIAEAMHTSKLTFEDKYKLSLQSGEGLASLASGSPKTFFASPELVEELRSKIHQQVETRNPDAAFGLEVLAEHSKDSSDHELVIQNYSESFIRRQDDLGIALASNPHVKPETELNLYKKLREDDVNSFNYIMRSFILSTSRKPRSEMGLKALNRSHPTLKKGSTPEEVKQKFWQLENVDESKLTNLEKNKTNSTIAEYYSYKENYDKVTQEMKIMSKNSRRNPSDNGIKKTYQKLEWIKTLAEKRMNADSLIENYEELLNK